MNLKTYQLHQYLSVQFVIKVQITSPCCHKKRTLVESILSINHVLLHQSSFVIALSLVHCFSLFAPWTYENISKSVMYMYKFQIMHTFNALIL